jgi:hypothetical protein
MSLEGSIRIVGPVSVVQQMKDRIRQLDAQYSEER